MSIHIIIEKNNPAVFIESPGRVNLTKENTDYNQVFVIFKAIIKKIYWETELFQSYLVQELRLKVQIFLKKESFMALVPYCGVFPYKKMIAPRKHNQHIEQLNLEEEQTFAEIIKDLYIKYDKNFKTNFPYSSKPYQQHTYGVMYPERHIHRSFYLPLLPFKTIQKFMAGLAFAGT